MIRDWVISNKRGKNEIVKVVSIEGGINYGKVKKSMLELY